jgi:asparagine synthase (glutamine-hydrolysing)
MCGIAGFAHLTPDVPKRRMAKILEGLDHRGPDDYGFYESAYASVGAVRLAILDPLAGSQPMLLQQPKIVIVFNGEIYNHSSLRRTLEDLGHRFCTTCDTETVLHAFLEWRAAAFARLHGMFAVAIWEEDERRLFLARDRMGIKPLYFCSTRSALYFGSELKAVFAHEEVERRINLPALQHFLTLNYVPGPQTLVEGIQKLPPGTFLVWQKGAIRVERYWCHKSFPNGNTSLADAEDELDRLLNQSVREHLMADAPLSVWVSGGLDSSAVLHYACRNSTRRLRTFSVTFAGRSFDESKDSRLVSECYGTEHREVDISPALDLASAVENIVHYSDEPNADAGAVPLWFLAKMTGEDVKVALSGDGADELFAGYQTYAADRLKHRCRGVPVPLMHLGRKLASIYPVSDEKIGFDYKATRLFSGLPLPAAYAHLSWNGTFTEQEKASVFRHYDPAISHTFLDSAEWDESKHWLQNALLTDQRFYLADNILAKCDRMSMAHSVEVRPPFLDHRIVEFANGLPPEMKLHGRTSKVVLRRLLKGKLPSRLLKKKKEGLDIPVHHWLRTALRPLLLDTLTPNTLRASGLFRDGAIRMIIDDHLGRRRNAGYHLWGLLILFLWMKEWNISGPADWGLATQVENSLALSRSQRR